MDTHGSSTIPQDGDATHLSCHSSQGPLCETCQGLRDLDQEISQTRDTLANLLDRRIRFKTSINSIHSPVIRRLPLEVTSSIFEFYAVDRSPLNLGAICRAWRQIAWSAPRIWTSLKVDISQNTTEARVEVVRDWLGRSGELPLSVAFLIDPKITILDLNMAHLNPMIDIVNQYSSRWQSLSLRLPPLQLQRFGEGAVVSSTLEMLHLKPLPWDASFKCNISASPFTVFLEGVRLRSLAFQWDKLTTVTTCMSYVDEVLQILRISPLLQKAAFEFVDTNPDTLGGIESVNFSHHNLKHLDIEFDTSAEMVADFFDAISLPALTVLKVSCGEEQLPHQAFVSFFERSSCALEVLSLRGWFLTDESLISVTKLMPTLAFLDIMTLPPQNPLDIFFRAFEAHITTSDQSEGSLMPGAPLLPRLQRFRWFGGHAFKWEPFRSLFSSLVEDGYTPRPLEYVQIRCDRESEEDSIPYIDHDTLMEVVNMRGLEYDLEVGLVGDEEGDDLVEMSFAKIKAEQSGGAQSAVQKLVKLLD